jgi:hypothetical protein
MPTTITMTGPGTATLIDDAAAAILAQNALLSAELLKISAALGKIADQTASINESLISMKNKQDSLVQAVSDVADSTKTSTQATVHASAIQAVAATNQIETNDKLIAHAEQSRIDAQLPAVQYPSIITRIKENIKNSEIMAKSTEMTSVVTAWGSNLFNQMSDWLTQTYVYTGIKSWLKKIGNSISDLITIPDWLKPADAEKVIKAKAVQASSAASDAVPSP